MRNMWLMRMLALMLVGPLMCLTLAMNVLAEGSDSLTADALPGSFEAETDGTPSGWLFVGQKEYVSLVNGEAKSGKTSVLVDKKSNEDVAGAMLHPKLIKVAAGKTYELSAYVKVLSAEEGAYVRALAHFYDDNLVLLSSMSCQAEKPTNGWTRISCTDNAPDNAALVKIFAPYARGKMKLYMDDVQFKEVSGVVTGIADLNISKQRREKIATDPNFWYFGDGGNGYLFSSARAIWSMETSKRRSKTVGVQMPEAEKRQEFIAEDIKYNPYVSDWGKYSQTLYAHNLTGRKLGQYVTAYKLTGYNGYLKRIKELCDFLLYSQYDNQGRNAFLHDYYPGDYSTLLKNPKTKLWRGGWPTHDFTWHNEFYAFPKCEPSHHMDAISAFNLVRAYELTGDQRYVEAAKKFIDGSNAFSGIHEGKWKGRTFYWTEYDPVVPEGSPNDAVDNIISSYAMPVAALGYYTGDQELIELARGLLWYMCKEIGKDGRWFYFGEESFLPPAQWSNSLTRKISHEKSCLIAVNKAMLYLEAAGVDVSPMRPYFADANLFYMGEIWGDYVKAYKLIDGKTLKPNDQITFVTLVYVLSDKISDIMVSDRVPTGFAVPEAVDLVITGPAGKKSLKVSYDELKQGVRIAERPRCSDIYQVSYKLQTPADLKMVDNSQIYDSDANMYVVRRPTIEVKTIGGKTQTVCYPNVQAQQLWFNKLDDVHINDLVRYLYGPTRLSNVQPPGGSFKLEKPKGFRIVRS